MIATSYDTRTQLQEKYPQSANLIATLEASEGVKVLCGVDATKLVKAGKLISQSCFDCIVFNFPHVGGLTRDVNRQVRYNQGGFMLSILFVVLIYLHFDNELYRIARWLFQKRNADSSAIGLYSYYSV